MNEDEEFGKKCKEYALEHMGEYKTPTAKKMCERCGQEMGMTVELRYVCWRCGE